MASSTELQSENRIVPDSVIPHGDLPALRYRNLPEPVPLRRMIGPSIMLAGLALGSGEFILWPYITYRSGFVFFWACLLGVTTQYFMNMEIARWTLATGESAITGFCRISRHWGPVFLALNIIPWMIPAWSKGAAQLVSWLIWPEQAGTGHSPYVTVLSVGGLIVCGLILTAGPVIYETVERIQLFLVTLVIVSVIVLALWLVRGDAVQAMIAGSANLGGLPPMDPTVITWTFLLGALAFAGAGGTLNLGQSNYIKDKGYGMGRHIGRITSPITGQEESVAEIGFHFPEDDANLRRWSQWWKAACIEHFVSFYLTCTLCLVLLTLITYSIFYTADGSLADDAHHYVNDISFVWGEAVTIEEMLGHGFRLLFLVMGVAILLTTEFGVLDATSRISTDIVKVNWLKDSERFSESRLYYLFLWGTIGLGITILVVGDHRAGAFVLFKLTAALNGGVMFLYCALLLYMNRMRLPQAIRINRWRSAILVWAVCFFGVFAIWAIYDKLAPG